MKQIGDRDNWVCQICFQSVDPSLPFDHPMHQSLDHKNERRNGGNNDPDNLQLVHHFCNHTRDAKA